MPVLMQKSYRFLALDCRKAIGFLHLSYVTAGEALRGGATTSAQVQAMLARLTRSLRPGAYAHFSDVMYQRTSSKEVDFCGPRFGMSGFEGKYVDSGWKRESLTLRAAFGAGVLATRGILDTSGAVWAVPAPFVCWMLNA